MIKATFDPAKNLSLYFRKSRNGSVTLVFKDADGADYDLTGQSFELLAPFALGIAVNTSTIELSFSADTVINRDSFFWELYNTTQGKTWLCGTAHFTDGLSAEVQDSEVPITIDPDGEQVLVTVAAGGGGNLYNSDGTVTSDRTVNGNEKDLFFENFKNLGFDVLENIDINAGVDYSAQAQNEVRFNAVGGKVGFTSGGQERLGLQPDGSWKIGGIQANPRYVITGLDNGVTEWAPYIGENTADTTVGEIVIDLNFLIWMTCFAFEAFDVPKTIVLTNEDNALFFTFSFEVTDVAAELTVPANWSLNANFSGLVWTPPAIGKYRFNGSLDKIRHLWYVEVSGPY